MNVNVWIFICAVMITTACAQTSILNSDYWIERMNLRPFFHGGWPYAALTPFGEPTSNLPPGFPKDLVRNTGSTAYLLFTPDHYLYPMYTYAGVDILNHLLGWPLRVYVIDPETEVMTNFTLGPRSKDLFTFPVPPGHFAAWSFEAKRPEAFALFSVNSSPEFVPGDDIVHFRSSLLERFPQHSKIIRRVTFPEPLERP